MPNFQGFLEGSGVEESVRGTQLGASQSSDEDVVRARIRGDVIACQRLRKELWGILSHGQSKF